MSGISTLTRDGIEESVLRADGPVFIDVWGPQCAPCLTLSPTFEALAKRFKGKGSFLKLEAPKNRMACVDLRVTSLPTFLHYEHGREVARLTDEISTADLNEFVESTFGAEHDHNARRSTEGVGK